MNPLHPVPPCEIVEGHDQCPRDYRVRDPELTRVTEGSLLGATIRLVAGFEPSTQIYSRTRISCQIFRGLELGWSHLAGNGTARFLHNLAIQLPDVVRYAWGEAGAQFNQLSGATAFCDQFVQRDSAGKKIGLNRLPAGLEWFVAGWYQVAPRGDVQDVYLASWAQPHLDDVTRWMGANNLRGKRTFAAGVRARNSGAPFTELRNSIAKHGEEEGLRLWLQGYNPTRANKLRTWPAFEGLIESMPTIADVRFGSSAPVYPEVAAPIAVSPGAPLVASVSGGGNGIMQRIGKNPWMIAGIAAAGVGVIGGAAWWLMRKRKPKRKRRRRR